MCLRMKVVLAVVVCWPPVAEPQILPMGFDCDLLQYNMSVPWLMKEPPSSASIQRTRAHNLMNSDDGWCSATEGGGYLRSAIATTPN